MSNNNKNIENLEFQAEVNKLLDLVANSLYSEREIFLRELISNSADACEKLRYLSIKKSGLLGKDKDLKININFSKKDKIIIIEDNGIGMNKNELIENLGTIARSGTSKFIEAMKSKKNNDISAIGQFGVGFYSSYMVADNVEVLSKNAENDESYLWKSTGKNNYSIEKFKKEFRGTKITLSIKKDSEEFLDIYKLRTIILKYSNYIPFPIYLKNLDNAKEKEEKINEGEPIWLKDKKNITNDDYKQFYNNISFNMDEPLKTIHFNAEGVINYTSILYLPTAQPMDLFNPERKNKIKLYVQKIFITDECEEIIPAWLRFVPGIIDSQDISLNISREMLQNNPVINKIKKGITNKILKEIELISKNEKNKYIDFWKNFGSVIKEGLYEFNEFHDKLLQLMRFQTSENDQFSSLDDYLKSIDKNQKEIYYFSNVEKNQIKNSPQLEAFIEKKIPVIFMTDAVDDFWIPNIGKYKDKEFKSITKGKVDLSKFNSNKDINKNKNIKIDSNINDLINVLKKELKENIKDVIVSSRLTKSPLIITADETGIDMNMEKLMKIHNKNMPDNKKILEINPKHPMILMFANNLKKINHKKMSSFVIDQANILDGNSIKNPSEYVENLTDLLINN